jgi:ferredoxin--NADP+ reductase
MDASIPAGYLRARVVRREAVTDDLAVFHLRPEQPLAFEPGQYVTLAAQPDGGVVVKRAYSVVSDPAEADLELFIECVAGGALTPCLFGRHEGDEVWVRRRVVGHFLLDARRTRHVMVCTVTGIAPFLSMMRAHRRARAAGADLPDHRFLVLFGASRAEELGPYRAELDALATEGWVDAVPTVSRPWDNPGWTGEVGRVNDVLRKHLDRLGWAGQAAVYACGNPDMIEAVKGIARRAGVDAADIHEEKYFTAPAEAAGSVVPTTTPAPVPARPPGPPGGIRLKSVPRG